MFGTGVVGLSTAIRVQETGKYNVTIIAETFPTDPRTIRYTSHWAVSVVGRVIVSCWSTLIYRGHIMSVRHLEMQDRKVHYRLVFDIPSRNLPTQYRLCGSSYSMVVQHWTRKHSRQCGRTQSPMQEERPRDFSSDIPTLNSERMASIPLLGWITCPT